MKYTNSIYTPDLSGKQGAVVFSKNQYGPYSCQKKTTTNPNTTYQQNVRSSTADIARQWVSLSPAQRLDWSKNSLLHPQKKKGKTYTLPGFYFFMKLNKNLSEVGEPLITDFPDIKYLQPQNISSFSVKMVNSNSGNDILLFFNPAINNKTKLSLFATMPLKLSLSYSTSHAYKIAVLDSSFISGSSIKDFYLHKHKQLPDSMSKVFFEIKSANINSGFTSVPKSCETYGI